MSVYLYATDPGARIEPTAGEKTSGFVPSTPAAAKKLNDVLYELTAFAVQYETLFAAEHDPSDGTHTNITGQTITLTGLASADDGKFKGDLVANSFVFGNNSGVATDEPIAVHSLIMQTFGLGNTANNADVIEVNFGSNNRLPSLAFTGGATETGIIPFYVPGNTDLDRFNFTIVAAGTYDIDWQLVQWDWTTSAWVAVTGGPVTGNEAGNTGGAPIIINLNFPDTNTPNEAGHGVRIGLSAEANIPGEKFMGLRMTSNDAGTLYVTKFSYLYWVSTVERAIQR